MQSVKVCAVGDGTVGKTCLLISYTTNCFPQDYNPTVFDNYSTNVMWNDAAIHMTLWDTAGQDDYQDMRPLSYPDTNVFLVCFAINNEVSFKNVKTKWEPEVRSHCPNVPIMLIGTKGDLRDTEKAAVSKTDADELAKSLKMRLYMECSALTQDGLSAVFDKAVEVAMGSKTPEKAKSKCVIL